MLRSAATKPRLWLRKPWLLIASVILLLTIGFLIRGLVRSAFVPYAYQQIYGDNLVKIYQSELAPLNPAIRQLGFVIPESDASCVPVYTETFSVEITCAVYPDMPSSRYSEEQVFPDVTDASAIDQLFVNNGWSANTTNEGNFAMFYDNSLNNKDQKSVLYYKHTDGVTCNLEMSNLDMIYGSTNGLELLFGCYESHYFLGNPNRL
jgi:hypothetical protein